ncbi:MAG: hypothetical protein H0V41_00300 [Pseudonocardiales bacterium]|nr:hypothetical protein [Pseudonocardiales bacterium]
MVDEPLISRAKLTNGPARYSCHAGACSEVVVIDVGLYPTLVTVEQGRVAARVPPQLLSGRTRVLRPVDAVGVYAHPRPEFARLERSGALRRVAPGYYAVVPDDRVGLAWLPELEAVALGVGVAAAGVDGAALMGLSAARVHGGIPRAVGVAVVAMAQHRPVSQLTDRDAVVLFVRRNLVGLDLQRHQTELGEGWVTSIEQTVVDLAARPDLGAMPQAVMAAVAALVPRADPQLLEELVAGHRRGPSVRRLLAQVR